MAWADDELVGRPDGLLVLVDPKHDSSCTAGLVAFTDERHGIVQRDTGFFLHLGATLVVLLMGLLVLLRTRKPPIPVVAHATSLHRPDDLLPESELGRLVRRSLYQLGEQRADGRRRLRPREVQRHLPEAGRFRGGLKRRDIKL